ncbi:MAG: superinfection immunity protein [Alphaproteobacteria bacterium]|nr:superinfection immunity protein [Alphaproteobacteria bacterium]
MTLFYIILIFLAYFLPFIVSLSRKHKDSTAIFVLNFLLGWTLIGWVIALIWSVKSFKS